MPRVIDNEEYLNTEEAMVELEVSRQHFYTNARPYLQVFHFDAKKKPWYRKKDVLDLKKGHTMRAAPLIIITGIFSNWTEHARALGLQVDTKGCKITIETLTAEQIPSTFHIEPNRQFARRGRISFVHQQPIAVWNTYYPLELVKDTILAEMKADEETDVRKRIEEVHGLSIGWAKERYSSRIATIEEQELLQLSRDEPVLILQRESYTQDHKTLILYSIMTLLGAWFAPEREYEVTQ